MIFQIIKEHQEVSDSFYNISFTAFVNCTADQGGAIFSNRNGTAAIKSCIFHRCTANGPLPDYGRGAAVLIRNSNVTFQSCCVDYSQSTYGGDIQTTNNPIIQFNYMQFFSGKFKYHPTFINGKYVNISFSNSSKNVANYNISQYGNIICFAHIEKLAAQYINGYQCNGSKSLFYFEYCNQNEFNISYVNAINNGHSSIITFSHSNNLNILFKESCFISAHDYNQFYSSNSENNTIKYSYCNFSITYNNNEESVEFVDCKSLESAPPNIFIDEKCYQHTPMKTFELNQRLLIYSHYISLVVISL